MKDFQTKAAEWALNVFGETIATNQRERNHRFIEEAIELVQSLNCSKEEVLALVDYVYDRPKGEPYQEVGGVMMALAILCNANDLDMVEDGILELKRISYPGAIEKIKAKHVTKPFQSDVNNCDELKVNIDIESVSSTGEILEYISDKTLTPDDAIECIHKLINVKVDQLNQARIDYKEALNNITDIDISKEAKEILAKVTQLNNEINYLRMLLSSTYGCIVHESIHNKLNK